MTSFEFQLTKYMQLLYIISIFGLINCNSRFGDNNNMKTINPIIVEHYTDIDEVLSSYIQKNDKLAVLLDYDGTLAPIATHPNFTLIEDESEEYLQKLARHSNVFLAIISGRGVHDVKTKVSIDNITYAGNHGLEILYPNGTHYVHEVSSELRDNYTKMVDSLNEKLAIHGAWVENKKSSLTYHYREVPENLQNDLKTQATQLIESYGYLANQAHCAIEAKPPVKWNKGEAAALILRENYGIDWPNKIRVIFAGDDTTDEDVMKLLQDTGGVSFRVTTSSNIETYANYRVPTTKTVSLILKWLYNTI